MQKKTGGFIKRNLTTDNTINAVLLFLLIEVILVVMIKPSGAVWTILLIAGTSVLAIPASFLFAIGIKYSTQFYRKPKP